jgi:predicted ArsR family transcriptional regulator
METAGTGGERHAGIRERVARLLLGRPQTAESLARELGVTENAVRAQLALLQREDAVAIQGELKGSRRPSALFGLRPGAESRFSRAYPRAFTSLVAVLSRRLSARELSTLMQELGRQMATGLPRAAGEPRQRLDHALRMLEDMGSHPVVTEDRGKVTVSGDVCPISEAVQVEHRSCLAMAGFLGEITGLRVTERCDRGGRPRCRFEITLPPKE